MKSNVCSQSLPTPTMSRIELGVLWPCWLVEARRSGCCALHAVSEGSSNWTLKKPGKFVIQRWNAPAEPWASSRPISWITRMEPLPQVDEEGAVGQVVRAIRKLRPQVLLTWPLSGVSGHPDHVAVSSWTEKAFHLAADSTAYPEHKEAIHEVDALYHIVVPCSLAETMKMPHLHTVPDEEVTLTLDVSTVWDAKMAAIRCHCSQIANSPILDAPEEQQHLFLGTEYFKQVTVQTKNKAI